MRAQPVGRWDTTPKIASPWKSILYKKGEGNRNDSGTFMSNSKGDSTPLMVEG